MGDFTEAEKSYIALFEATKARLPDAFCSIKNLAIVDRKTLMKSLFYYISQHYQTGAIVVFGDGLLEAGRKDLFYTLTADSVLYNTKDKTSTDLENDAKHFVKKIMNYLPSLPLTLPKDNSFLTLPKNKKRLAKFLQHLEINRTLLLEGPPNANEHTIDPVKAAEWVAAQYTPERRRLAKILLDNIIYIPHKQILDALRECVNKVKTQIIEEGRLENPIILITGRIYKSNYYIALLFAHFWLQAGMRIDCVTEKYGVDTIQMTGTILDVDDMAYSGNQTRVTLSSVGKMVFNSYRDHIKNLLKENKDFQESYIFIPRLAIESMLESKGLRYFVIRAFMSEHSVQEITKDGVCLPMQVVTYSVIPYLPGVSEEDKIKLEKLFNMKAYTTVYLDHKVSDTPSTFLLPISFGVVPRRTLMSNLKQLRANDRSLSINEIDGYEVEFFPFIRHCGSQERLMPRNRTNMLINDVRDEIRCPYAWYKYIDYDTGIYPSIPLPYGATNENFVGGKRKTRRQQRRVKHKTRSHSK